MSPVLSILVPTLTHRNWQPLMNELARQMADMGGQAEVLFEGDDGSVPSGIKRQRLLNRARGDYVCCLDDDDWISPDYVSSLVSGCLTGVSVVTFDLLLKRSDRKKLESWSYRLGSDNRNEGTMAANHLCAWQRKLATLVGWCPHLGYGDDQLWYKPLALCGIKLTELHISDTLYEYRYCPTETSNQRWSKVLFARSQYAVGGLRCYWHSDDTIAVESGNRRTMFGSIGVINSKGEDVLADRTDLREFGVVTIK